MDNNFVSYIIRGLRQMTPELRQYQLNTPGLTPDQRERIRQAINNIENPPTTNSDEYYITGLLPVPHSQDYTNATFFTLINDVLNDFNHEAILIEIDGTAEMIVDESKTPTRIDEFRIKFNNMEAFNNWLNAFKIKYNTTLSRFTGVKVSEKYNFKLHKRSKQGRGTNVMLSIKEYKGKNCYIPTDENCFYKCIKFIYQDKAPTQEEFNKWLFHFEKSKGCMTNKRIAEHNKFFKRTPVFRYNEDDKKFYPGKLSRGYLPEDTEWVIYNYYPNPDYNIGHYCLLKNQSSMSKSLEELKDNFIQEWKQPDEKNIKRFKPFVMSTKSRYCPTYIWDCETYRNERKQCKPYSAGIIFLDDVQDFFDTHEEYIKPNPPKCI